MAQTTTGFGKVGRGRQHTMQPLVRNNIPYVDAFLDFRKERRTVQDLEHELGQLEANRNIGNKEADTLRKVLDQLKVENHCLKSKQGRQKKNIRDLELDLKSMKQTLDDANTKGSSLVEEHKRLGGRYDSLIEQAHEYYTMMEYINSGMSQDRRDEIVSQLGTNSLRPLDCYKYIESQLDEVINGQEEKLQLRSQNYQLSSEKTLLTKKLSREIEDKDRIMIELERSRAELKATKASISETKPEHKLLQQECNGVLQSDVEFSAVTTAGVAYLRDPSMNVSGYLRDSLVEVSSEKIKETQPASHSDQISALTMPRSKHETNLEAKVEIEGEDDSHTPDETQKPATDRPSIEEVAKWPIKKVFNRIKMQDEQLIKDIKVLKKDIGEISCRNLAAHAADMVDTAYGVIEEVIEAALENRKPGKAALTQLLLRHAVLSMKAHSTRILGTDQASDLNLVAYLESMCDKIRTTIEDINYFVQTGMIRKMVDDGRDYGNYKEELADSAPPKNIIRNGE